VNSFSQLQLCENATLVKPKKATKVNIRFFISKGQMFDGVIYKLPTIVAIALGDFDLLQPEIYKSLAYSLFRVFALYFGDEEVAQRWAAQEFF
jgi:hypothetical protein